MSKVLKFPDGFLWGAATSSYQVEGGIYNNDWALAAKSGRIMPAGLATDHYHRYEEDFDLAKLLGHNGHRLSIEWARIEPEPGFFDKKEIEHYRSVLKALNKRGITPFVTLWHFTLPDWVETKGGFENKEVTGYFSRYCAHVVKELQGECVHWSTMNEPIVYLSLSYMWGQWPPFYLFKIRKVIKVFNNLVKAHKMSYSEIKKVVSKADVGIVKNNMYMHVSKFSKFNPFNYIGKIFNDFFWNKLFLIKTNKHIDSIGLNYYFHSEFGKKEKYIKNDMGWDLYPEGIYYVLMDLKKYKKPIYIAEAGIADSKDQYRADYIRDLIINIHKAISDGVNVKAFMYWSLLDNYEWIYAYSQKFGLIEVNMKTRERKIRDSAYEYKKICQNNSITI